jgi:aryl-alcohol dehydrogenase-like predicted oxidoreductase
MNKWQGVKFGLGLLEIGKRWGAHPRDVPAEEESRRLLDAAWRLGVRVFDTAASYGDSEEKFGRWLDSLDAAARAELFVATKFGEHWNADRGEPWVDHSYDALTRSLDRSLERLGRIDLVQVHKTSLEALASAGFWRALEETRRRGVARIGASASSLDVARAAIECGRFDQIQVPFNRADTRFAPVIAEATRRGMLVFTNRPLKMGALVEAGASLDEITGCFRAVLAAGFSGAVLCGTASVDHLEEDVLAFAAAQ